MKDIKAVFDIGNDSIKAVVFAKDDDKDVVLSKHIQPTQGMRKGKILDANAFWQTINTILEKINQKLWGDFIDEVFVGVSHPESIVKRIQEQKRIMTDEINENDIDHLSRVIADIAEQPNYETIKIVPVCRIVDESRKERDPIGLKGKKLELIADAFMLPKNLYNWIIESFDNLWLSVVDIVPNIIAASEVVLDYDHRDLWTMLVDIGKNQTTFSIFEDWFPLWYWTLAIGSEEITKDISIGMQIDIKDAEEIKKTYWNCYIEKEQKEDTPIDQHFLTEIINARYEEIFDKINEYLERIWKIGRLPWWTILIWWGAKLTNLDILAKNTFKLACFYGKANQNIVWDLESNLQFVNVLWIYARSNKYIEWRKGSKINIKIDIVNKVKWFFQDLF